MTLFLSPTPPPRHRAESSRVKLRTVFGTSLVALACTGSLNAGAVREAEPAASQQIELPAMALSGANLEELDRVRQLDASRGRQRVRTARPVTLEPRAVGYRFATAPLNVWTGPGERFQRVGLIPVRARLRVTGQVSGHWAEVILGDRDQVRWVNHDYLARHKPPPPPKPETSDSTSRSGGPAKAKTSSTETSSTETSSTETPSTEDQSTPSSSPTAAPSGVSGAACPDGSSVESGLTSGAVALYRAVCAAFPALTTYGGYDQHGEHADGRAIDFMITDSSLGQAVAEFIRANAGALGVRDIIWAQHIWTPEQASAGWRYMSDRGSPTANHYDHVHAAVF